MSVEYAAVVSALPHLSPDERGRIAERLKLLGSLAPGQTLAAAPGEEDEEDDATILLMVIVEVVLRISGERANPIALRRSNAFPAFRVKARDLGAFVAKHVPTRAQRRALMALGVDLLYRDLARAGFSVTSRTLMACVHQMPSVFEKSFPGYAASGFLGMVVGCKQMEKMSNGTEAKK